MRSIKFKNITAIAFIAFALNGCTEAYPLLTNTYEEAIVIEATITNELKTQEIKITKSAKFEDEKYLPESGAKVTITDDAGNQYNFKDDGEKYVSEVEFQALPDRKYQLHIITADGRSFESSPETLTAINPMKNVQAAAETNDDGIRGVSIRVISSDPTHQSNYYRYEYEETYKIVTPKWATTKAILDEKGRIVFVENSPSTKVCYGSKKSADLFLVSTNNLSEDNVNFLLRFLSQQDYIITTRYSILVKQYIESLNAFTYYKTLKQITDSGSVLSPTQPGILLGNIRSVNNPNNKIVGYFDVTSVSTKRIYFNYTDFFLGEAPPPYVTDCNEYCYGLFPCTHMGSISEDLQFGFINFFLPGEPSYWVNAPCGDCTTFASNLKPPFWTD